MRRMRPASSVSTHTAARVRGSYLKSLGDAPIAPSTGESLNELSQSQSDGESPPPEEHP